MRSLLPCASVNVAFGFSLLALACTDTSTILQPELELGRARQAIESGLPIVFTPKTAAAVTGRSVGVAVSAGPLLSEPIYAQTIVDYFGDVTPENELKWGVLQPVDARTWSFGNADAIVSFATTNGLR